MHVRSRPHCRTMSGAAAGAGLLLGISAAAIKILIASCSEGTLTSIDAAPFRRPRTRVEITTRLSESGSTKFSSASCVSSHKSCKIMAAFHARSQAHGAYTGSLSTTAQVLSAFAPSVDRHGCVTTHIQTQQHLLSGHASPQQLVTVLF